MTLPMVHIDGVPDRDDVRPGMAFFSGTGPEGKTCGDCKFRGYRRESSVGHWDERLQGDVYRSYSVLKCSIAKQMAGRHLSDVDPDNPCCKYFEKKS